MQTRKIARKKILRSYYSPCFAPRTPYFVDGVVSASKPIFSETK
jgi:hypothetical protein